MKWLFKILKIAFTFIGLGLCLIYCNKNTTPVVEINNIAYITPATAMVFASVKSDGGAVVTSRGVCWSTSENPDYSDYKTSDGDGGGAYSSGITNLSPETKYYVRAYATNSEGVGYSKQESLTTILDFSPPDFQTGIFSYTTNEAHVSSKITNEGTALVTVCGICWSTSQNPQVTDSHTTTGVSGGEFISPMKELIPNTKYFIKTYATTLAGTFYSNEISFTTLSENNGRVNDIEGNSYKLAVIGTQTWMAENLKSTKYNDGTAIPLVSDAAGWCALSTPGYCWYGNDEATYKAPYGAIYNWYVVDSASNGGKNVCPTGWYVPSDEEWDILATYLGGADVAGGKLKEEGTTHWLSPNEGATNETSFTALPGGYCNANIGVFDGIGYWGFWHSSSPWARSSWESDNYYITASDKNFWFNYYDKRIGISIRCLKNN
jgi:uncharacterized protein (TIGR02145 family)